MYSLAGEQHKHTVIHAQVCAYTEKLEDGRLLRGPRQGSTISSTFEQGRQGLREEGLSKRGLSFD